MIVDARVQLMEAEDLSPRMGVAIGLLAILPALWYAFGRPSTAGFIASVNVVIIFVALYTAMSPTDGDHGSSSSAA